MEEHRVELVLPLPLSIPLFNSKTSELLLGLFLPELLRLIIWLWGEEEVVIVVAEAEVAEEAEEHSDMELD
jgi:hypothetical protein